MSICPYFYAKVSKYENILSYNVRPLHGLQKANHC